MKTREYRYLKIMSRGNLPFLPKQLPKRVIIMFCFTRTLQHCCHILTESLHETTLVNGEEAGQQEPYMTSDRSSTFVVDQVGNHVFLVLQKSDIAARFKHTQPSSKRKFIRDTHCLIHPTMAFRSHQGTIHLCLQQQHSK